MSRLACVVALAVAFLAAPLAADAQPAGKSPRIGVLRPGSSPDVSVTLEAFQQGLRELGWVEGTNIVIDYRFAEGRLDRLPDLAAELVRLKVDVVVAAGATPAAVAAKNATRTIPIVMIAVSDPVEQGLIASLARPGGNLTGLSYSAGVEIFGKGLELFKEAVPTVRFVAILSNPANPTHALAVSGLKIAARSLGVQLQLLEARDPGEFEAAFAAMVRERAGALLVVPDAFLVLHRARLADLAARHQLPSMHGDRLFAEAGGLISYGPNVPDLFRRAASYVDRILKGAKPADLPVEQPTKFDLVINLKTAKALGLIIPPSILARAAEVIE